MWIRIWDPVSGIFVTLDPGSGVKNSDTGSGKNIRDLQHWFKGSHGF